LLGFGGAAFGTPVMPSSANGSSPPKDDGCSVGKSGRGLLGSRTGVREVCVSEIGKTVCGGAVGIWAVGCALLTQQHAQWQSIRITR
jgi:hypothetical protein